MTTNREHIPAEIKRVVRKKCGFGCVICGMPFFDYEHIEEYSKVKKHEEHNITLLCPNHHSATTTKKLTKERIKYANNNPYNIRKNNCLTANYHIGDSRDIDITIGSNTFTPPIFQNGNGEAYPVIINNCEFFSVYAEEHYLCVSFILTNIDGEILLKADKGNLQVGINNFDYTYEGNVIRINHKKLYDVSIEMLLTNAKVEILKGSFIDENTKDGLIIEKRYFKNFGMQNDNQKILCTEIIFNGARIGNCLIGNETIGCKVGFLLHNPSLGKKCNYNGIAFSFGGNYD